MEQTSGLISIETLAPIFESITEQISVGNVVSVVAAIVGLCIGFVFMWWAGRKGSKMLMKSFKNGKFGF